MIRAGEQYRAGLRGGREVWIDGERFRDVTVHPFEAGGTRDWLEKSYT